MILYMGTVQKRQITQTESRVVVTWGGRRGSKESWVNVHAVSISDDKRNAGTK